MRNFLNVIYKSFGAVLISMLLFVNAHSEEWHIPLETKEGGYVGAEIGFAPGFDIGVIGGYQWYFYDKPYFHLGARLAGHFDYLYYDSKLSGKTHYLVLGVAPQFIWDFLNIDSHTLGVHFAPLGFNIQARFYEASGASVTGTYILFAAAYEFITGLHYYIDIHHQLYLTFRFANAGGYGKNMNAEYPWNLGISYINLGYAYKF